MNTDQFRVGMEIRSVVLLAVSQYLPNTFGNFMLGGLVGASRSRLRPKFSEDILQMFNTLLNILV